MINEKDKLNRKDFGELASMLIVYQLVEHNEIKDTKILEKIWKTMVNEKYKKSLKDFHKEFKKP